MGTACGDGAGMGANPVGKGTGTTGMDGDGDKFLPPCSCLIHVYRR